MLPLLRAVCFNMPPLYPNAIWMAFELAAYGGFVDAIPGILLQLIVIPLIIRVTDYVKK
ncbi:MAG: hypothetical protein KIG65_02940 [Eubacteriales bacterium]|nr:hypothetical protein [Eubacteriales bacterium]